MVGCDGRAFNKSRGKQLAPVFPPFLRGLRGKLRPTILPTTSQARYPPQTPHRSLVPPEPNSEKLPRKCIAKNQNLCYAFLFAGLTIEPVGGARSKMEGKDRFDVLPAYPRRDGIFI